jgi:hypothetical protein
MYSRQHASLLKQEFWTVFGQYMKPVLSSEGEKVNWINYKTGVKNIFFKMEAGGDEASIGIEMNHEPIEIQKLYFDHFLQLKQQFMIAAGEGWQWQLHTLNVTNKVISKIETRIQNVNIFQKEDWPRLISFFKPRIIALDEFWNRVKYGFEGLRY